MPRMATSRWAAGPGPSALQSSASSFVKTGGAQGGTGHCELPVLLWPLGELSECQSWHSWPCPGGQGPTLLRTRFSGSEGPGPYSVVWRRFWDTAGQGWGWHVLISGSPPPRPSHQEGTGPCIPLLKDSPEAPPREAGPGVPPPSSRPLPAGLSPSLPGVGASGGGPRLALWTCDPPVTLALCLGLRPPSPPGVCASPCAGSVRSDLPSPRQKPSP